LLDRKLFLHYDIIHGKMSKKVDKFTLKKHGELLNHILEELKSKVNRKDFELLEKRVASITG